MSRGRYERRVWQADPSLYAPARHRRACAYRVFVPEPLRGVDVHLPGDLAGVVSTAEAAIAALNGTADPALAPLARLLLRTESIASSKVEGLQVDSRALARAEAKQDSGQRIGAETAEILANVDAMQLAIEQMSGVRSIRVAHIVDVHRALMRRTPHAQIAGQLRAEQNWIGGNDYNPCGADFVPPPPELVVPLLKDLCTFCNDDAFPPMVQAALAHAQFETIHPFADGNGRTGRALVQVVLRRRGLAPNFVPPISVILAGDKDGYIKGLTHFREDRVGRWLERFAVATARAARLAEAYLGDVRRLQDDWRARLTEHSNPRTDAAAWSLIEVLPAHPIVSIGVAAAATGRTRPAIANAVEELESAGVLSRISESVRYRAWEARGLLDIVASVESGDYMRKTRRA
jgi:Fic family protein